MSRHITPTVYKLTITISKPSNHLKIFPLPIGHPSPSSQPQPKHQKPLQNIPQFNITKTPIPSYCARVKLYRTIIPNQPYLNPNHARAQPSSSYMNPNTLQSLSNSTLISASKALDLALLLDLNEPEVMFYTIIYIDTTSINLLLFILWSSARLDAMEGNKIITFLGDQSLWTNNRRLF